MRSTLFDRFESDRNPGIDALLNDLADLLGARRPYPGRLPGVLNWGLAIPKGLSPGSGQDREYLARHIEDVIREFEPRLSGVQVLVLERQGEFGYEIVAKRVDQEDHTLALRVLTPRRGGGLGADVVVLGFAGDDAR